jgi:integrase
MGRYAKLGKPNRAITVEDLHAGLKKLEHEPLAYRAYLALVYWVGCRRGEPLRLLASDVYAEGFNLFIKHLPAFKRGHRAEVIELPLNLEGVDLIMLLAGEAKGNYPLFNFSSMTGYRIIVKALGVYPHWLRYDRITKIRRTIDGKKVSIDDAKSFTGIRSDRTMQGYGMTTDEAARRVSAVLE